MSDEEQHNYKSISSHMAKGAIWMVMMRWSLKAIGLVNTVIIARLLSPDDFGVVAMALIVVG
ncbi:MAG: O-antigen/teichoic acid export membrane protein [Alphaproteobacteria bacterium]|jgi:O-antigen/teichoic acid export membrane protein